MLCLSDHDAESLANLLARRGHNPANATRVLREYWGNNGSLDVAALGISKAARNFLREEISFAHSIVLHRHCSGDGTIKLLVAVAAAVPAASPSSSRRDGGSYSDVSPTAAVECVLMPSHRPDRAAACISSQIGCGMGCDFCASTKEGLERNLGVGEIIQQFMHLRAEALKLNRRIASLVFMGMGEPMHNLDNVIPAIRLLAEPGLGGLGFRAITISTVGIVPGIQRLAQANVPVQLAVSLHAPDDATRDRLVPSNRRWPVAEVMAAVRAYQDQLGRPVNIEYCMLAGVNDSDEQALLLAGLMEGFRAHVNLIPYNAIGAGVSGTVYERPSANRIVRFADLLRQEKVVVHIRQTRGDDISAACGQLRVSQGKSQK